MTSSILQDQAAKLRELRETEAGLLKEWSEAVNEKNQVLVTLDGIEHDLIRIEAAQTCIKDQIHLTMQSMRSILDAGE